MLEQITPLILTYNEENNINRTLEKLKWASKIIVIDSYSTDTTLEILSQYPQVEVFSRKFDTHATQWNYGLEKVATEWVLSLDADYIVTDALTTEIKNLSPNSGIDGYFAKFKYCVFGKPLRGTILPPRQILFRKDKAIYIDDGHTQLLKNQGKSSQLSAYIHHDDRKPIDRWFLSETKYSVLEAEKLLNTPQNELDLGDKIRMQKLLAPIIVPLYYLILKGGILDGWRGCYYVFQRIVAEILLSMRLIALEYNKK
ncbi:MULTISPECIES: glycosyltransferase family 2 protein [Nostocales]|uniref:Glycosyltransferase family 2 protein n=1 Tax=Dolichospermum flos-aquae UHCC 0037 TaxID=2590026 RepID=A0ACC7S1X6_DOLFA|nr:MULTISPECIES: glycosyltransferase family 2 protein [Nostocales]MBO1063887.1 glycosyltransferase family 2 protein [Anabaena sp. 54]MCX5984430.1 glycosyltransferase family 2 protein [Nostocales cyanobacterium LacPavin_0920_SED1_MAG_38_18]MTJ42487.1 glycosyltransferase family 2 protein [Dolichospermum flos-aquae UHCC 0037]